MKPEKYPFPSGKMLCIGKGGERREKIVPNATTLNSQ